MKPDWKNAPEWAMWLSCDDDGEWTWFELEPVKFTGHSTFYVDGDTRGKYDVAVSGSLDFGSAVPYLEPRP